MIPAEQSIVVPVLFDSIPEKEFNVQAELLSVIPVEQDSPRYLDTQIQIQESILDSAAQIVQIRGTARLLNEESEATTVWIVALAYDEDDQIVGFRKWIAQENLLSGQALGFELTVYSLGPPITRWELLTEARP
jgi:hypothetical protein